MTETLELDPPLDPAELEFPDEAHAAARIATAASGTTIRMADLMFRQDRLRIMIISPLAPAEFGRRLSRAGRLRMGAPTGGHDDLSEVVHRAGVTSQARYRGRRPVSCGTRRSRRRSPIDAAVADPHLARPP
jgi:hypothetical protein